MKIVRISSPHLHYLLSSYSMTLGSINYLQTMMFEFGGIPIPTFSFNRSFIEMNNCFQLSRQYFHLISAGGPLAEEVPFKRFIDGVRRASPTNCSNTSIRSMISEIKKQARRRTIKNNLDNGFNKKFSKILPKEGFNDLASILRCSPVDLTIVLIEPIALYLIIPYYKGEMPTIDPNAPAYETIWQILISPLYELFFEPLHQDIIPTILMNLKKREINIYQPLFLFL